MGCYTHTRTHTHNTVVKHIYIYIYCRVIYKDVHTQETYTHLHTDRQPHPLTPPPWLQLWQLTFNFVLLVQFPLQPPPPPPLLPFLTPLSLPSQHPAIYTHTIYTPFNLPLFTTLPHCPVRNYIGHFADEFSLY